MSTPRYPSLSEQLRAELRTVEPSEDAGLQYFPCDVELVDGSIVRRVYLAEASSYFDAWGVWPEDDRAKRSISIRDVVHVMSSELRLPARMANRLYAAGESGMGYYVFTVVLRDGRRIPIVTGDAVDFPPLPDGVTVRDIVDVARSSGPDIDDPDTRDVPYFWCLFSAVASTEG